MEAQSKEDLINKSINQSKMTSILLKSQKPIKLESRLKVNHGHNNLT